MNKPTLTIGIAAYNEEKNIKSLLTSLVNQLSPAYQLNHIIVISDRSEDKTDKLVESLSLPYVKLIRNTKRQGKGYAIRKLLKLSKQNNSDFLLILDADLQIRDKQLVEKLVAKITKEKDLSSVSGLVLPKKPENFIQKIGYIGFYVWEDMIQKTSKSLYYRSSDALIILRVSDFPLHQIASYSYIHDEFYFLYALKRGKKFSYLPKANAYFTLPKTYKDYTKQMKRYLGKHLDENEVHTYAPYAFTATDKVRSLIKVGKTQFFAGIGYFLMQTFLHLEKKLVNTKIQGTWESITSTK